MTPAWERIWCAEEKSVHHGKSKDFVPEPPHLNFPSLGLVGWRYNGDTITAEDARDIFEKIGIEVSEDLKQYLPPKEDEEGTAHDCNASVNDDSRTKTQRIISKQHRR